MNDEEDKSKLERIKGGAKALLSATSVHFPLLMASVRHLEKSGGAARLPADDVNLAPRGTNPNDQERGSLRASPDQTNERSHPTASRSYRGAPCSVRRVPHAE